MVQPNLAVLADDGGRTRLRVKDGVLLINRRMGQIEYETSGVFGIGGRHDQFPLSEVGPVCMKTESDADGDLWQEVFLMPEAEGVKPIRLYYEQLSPPETSDARVNKGGDTCRRACELARDLAGKVKIDGATVVKADINCSNGVVHVIDSVILPE